MERISRYLAKIGQRGGRRSRRVLDPATARDMVRVREARRAFERFRSSCFASPPARPKIGLADVAWVAARLRQHGDREALRIAARLAPLRDTSEAAERVRLEAIRKLEPTRRLRAALDLSELARALARHS